MPGHAPYKPEQATLSVGAEPTQAEAVQPDRSFGLVQESTSLPDPSIQWIEERVIGGDRKIFNKVDGQRVYEGGSIPVVPYDGAPLAYMMGSETVNTDTDIDGNSETGTDTHVLTINSADLPPTQTIEAGYKGFQSGQDNFVRTFSGAAVNSGEISMNNESELQTSLDYIAMDVTEGSVDSNGDLIEGTTIQGPESPADRQPWIFADVASDLTMFGTSFARVEQFSFSLTNNLEQGRYIQTDDPEKPFEITYANAEIEMSATITVDDNTLYNELRNPTQGGFDSVIDFEKPGSEERLRIKAIDCNFSEAPHEIPGDDSTIQVDVSIIPEDLEIRVEDVETAGSSYL